MFACVICENFDSFEQRDLDKRKKSFGVIHQRIRVLLKILRILSWRIPALLYALYWTILRVVRVVHHWSLKIIIFLKNKSQRQIEIIYNYVINFTILQYQLNLLYSSYAIVNLLYHSFVMKRYNIKIEK